MRAVCALGPLMSAFALLALGGRVLGSRVLGSRWRSGLGRAPAAGMHCRRAPLGKRIRTATSLRSGVAAVLAVVAVLRIHCGPGSLVDRQPGVGGPKCLR